MGGHFAGKKVAIVRPVIEQILRWTTATPSEKLTMMKADASLTDALLALGLARSEAPNDPASTSPSLNSSQDEATSEPFPVRTVLSSGEDETEVPSSSFTSLKAVDQVIEAVDTGEIKVPRLSFDLSRVLFNPGVYQLQDPRSRVYNFDPYLEP